MKYTASRLSDGNKVFPCQIETENTGITVKIPGLFNNNEKFIGYENISEVSINTPMIGYSSIEFYSKGKGTVRAHGFSSDEVKSIRRTIKDMQENENSSGDCRISENGQVYILEKKKNKRKSEEDEGDESEGENESGRRTDDGLPTEETESPSAASAIAAYKRRELLIERREAMLDEIRRAYRNGQIDDNTSYRNGQIDDNSSFDEIRIAWEFLHHL